MVDPVSFVGLAGVPLIVALVQVVKGTFPQLATHYLPLVTIGVAIALNVGLALLIGSGLGLAVLVGLVAAVSASGLYSWATSTSSAAAPASPLVGPTSGTSP